MIVLISGIASSIDQRLAMAARVRGLKVRGLSRSRDKMESNVSHDLELFVKANSHEDVLVFDKAVVGVDAVITPSHPQRR